MDPPIAIETTWPAKPKILTIRSFIEKSLLTVDLKDAEVVSPSYLLLISLVQLLRKLDDASWKMTVDNLRLNQLSSPITATSDARCGIFVNLLC